MTKQLPGWESIESDQNLPKCCLWHVGWLLAGYSQQFWVADALQAAAAAMPLTLEGNCILFWFKLNMAASLNFWDALSNSSNFKMNEWRHNETPTFKTEEFKHHASNSEDQKSFEFS